VERNEIKILSRTLTKAKTNFLSKITI